MADPPRADGRNLYPIHSQLHTNTLTHHSSPKKTRRLAQVFDREVAIAALNSLAIDNKTAPLPLISKNFQAKLTGTVSKTETRAVKRQAAETFGLKQEPPSEKSKVEKQKELSKEIHEFAHRRLMETQCSCGQFQWENGTWFLAEASRQGETRVVSLHDKELIGEGSYMCAYKVKNIMTGQFEVLKCLHFRNLEPLEKQKQDLVQEVAILTEIHSKGDVAGIQPAPYKIIDFTGIVPNPLIGALYEYRHGDANNFTIILNFLHKGNKTEIANAITDLINQNKDKYNKLEENLKKTIPTNENTNKPLTNAKLIRIKEMISNLENCLAHVNQLSLHEIAFLKDDQFIIENALQLLSAVKYLSDNKIVHADIKPSNILVQRNGMMEIADFAGSRTCEQMMRDSTKRGLLGTRTERYCSPHDMRHLLELESLIQQFDSIKQNLPPEEEIETRNRLEKLHEEMQSKRMVYALGVSLHELMESHSFRGTVALGGEAISKYKKALHNVINQMLDLDHKQRISIDDAYAAVKKLRQNLINDRVQTMPQIPHARL